MFWIQTDATWSTPPFVPPEDSWTAAQPTHSPFSYTPVHWGYLTVCQLALGLGKKHSVWREKWPAPATGCLTRFVSTRGLSRGVAVDEVVPLFYQSPFQYTSPPSLPGPVYYYAKELGPALSQGK